jgi:hypothetical protein
VWGRDRLDVRACGSRGLAVGGMGGDCDVGPGRQRFSLGARNGQASRQVGPGDRESKGERTGEASAPTGRSHWLEREGGSGRVARVGQKAEGKGLWASFPFSFYSKLSFPFLFIYSFEFKIKHATNSNLNTSSICIKRNQSLEFNMMQQFILPEGLIY